MKTLAESLFDKNLAEDDITTLYDLFGSHIKKFQHSYGGGIGWTHYFDQYAVVREWKKLGCPKLSGGFAKTTFPPDLQKFIAVILKNMVITKSQLKKTDPDGNFDDEILNDKLMEAGILCERYKNTRPVSYNPNDPKTRIRVQIAYIDGTPASPDHGVQFRPVGLKRFKGLNTDKIELSIYAYDEDRSGFGRHIWTLLTDLSIKDFK